MLGEVAEWSIAAVLKTVELRGSGGSNPSLSARSRSKKVSRNRYLLLLYLGASSYADYGIENNRGGLPLLRSERTGTLAASRRVLTMRSESRVCLHTMPSRKEEEDLKGVKRSRLKSAPYHLDSITMQNGQPR